MGSEKRGTRSWISPRVRRVSFFFIIIYLDALLQSWSKNHRFFLIFDDNLLFSWGGCIHTKKQIPDDPTVELFLKSPQEKRRQKAKRNSIGDVTGLMSGNSIHIGLNTKLFVGFISRLFSSKPSRHKEGEAKESKELGPAIPPAALAKEEEIRLPEYHFSGQLQTLWEQYRMVIFFRLFVGLTSIGNKNARARGTGKIRQTLLQTRPKSRVLSKNDCLAAKRRRARKSLDRVPETIWNSPLW